MQITRGTPPGSYLFEGVLVAVLVVAPALTIAVLTDMEHGSLAAWVAAIATVGALAAATVAARSAAETLRRGLAREIRSQAEQVSMWADDATLVASHPGAAGDDSHDELHVLRVTLRNASPLPVTNVKVWAAVRLRHKDPAAVELFGRIATLPVLPPGEDHVADLKAYAPFDVRRFDDLNTTALNRVILHMRFTDAAGVEWKRSVPGGLDEFTGDDRADGRLGTTV